MNALASATIRDNTITECLRAVDREITSEPTFRELQIIAALKALRTDAPLRVTGDIRVDYLGSVQRAAQAAHGGVEIGPEHSASAGMDTPLGRLRAVTWRAVWKAERIAWASEYYLNDEPITIAEIREAGLARRPKTRNRKKGTRK